MMGGIGMGFGGLFGILLIGLAVWAVVKLSGGHTFQTGGSANPSLNESPQDILKKRYARGEISREEFEQMKKNLNS
ncbi:MAG: SHOCT domain-containing protein [Calditrichota bacterium]|jgi:putative membrane protein